MDDPNDRSYFRNIDVETSLPIDPPRYLFNAPRAIEINKPPVAGKGFLHEVHPSRILQGGAPVPPAAPPHARPPPVNPSVISKDLDVTPGPDIPIQQRLVDNPAGSGYVMGPPADLKWNINFFAENQRISYNQSNEWEGTVMAPPPKAKPLPWHAGRGPWARAIDTSETALEDSFDKYNCLIESLAVSRIQKLIRQRNRRAEGREWRQWYVIDQAATKMQSAARILLARQIAGRHRNVRVLQRWTRGWHARRRVTLLKWKAMEKHMVRVAVTLQKVVRGRLGRVKWKQRRLAYTIAVIKLQAVARGRFGRKHYSWYARTLCSAAATMQKATRQFLSVAHKYRKERTELKAATMLQRVWRGKSTRGALIFRFAEQAWAATMLAASYRGHKGRRRAAAIKEKKWVDEIPLRAATMMQKAWRRKRIFKMMKVVKEHLRMMRAFCLADDKMELMEFVNGLEGKELPLHGVVDRHGNTLMHISAQRNKTEVIPILIKAGLNVNVKNDNGWRPLHGAIMNLANDAVKELIRQKASVNSKNNDGYTPLHQACFFDNFSALKILLSKKKKVKPNEQTIEKKYTPLHLGALQGMSKPSIEVLMKFEPSRNMCDADGLTPVHLAAQLGQAQLLEGLLDGKFNADLRDAQGRTALMTAAQAGNEEAVHQLLIAKSMPYFRDKDGWMAHHYCAEAGMVSVLRRLLEQFDIHPDAPNGDGWSALHLAASGQDKVQMDIIEMLTNDFNADVNCQDNDGRAPVHIAAQEGSMEALELLFGIPHCAREAEDFTGATPMFIALNNNQFNIGRFCVKEGCNFQHRDKGGCNMLMLAIKEDNPHWVDYFLRIKMDLKQVDGRGYNVLHFAAEFNRPKYVHIVEADPQARGLLVDQLKGLTAKSSGWTPLHVAAYAGNVEALEALVAVGCPIDIQDHSGQVALHVGCANGQPLAIRFLLGAKAMQFQDWRGRNPCHIAASGPPPSIYIAGRKDKGEICGFEDGGRPNDCVRAIMELYNHGVNLNVQNPREDGKTPLHYAAEAGRSREEGYDSLDILIRLGAQPKLLTHSWKTPRDLAIAAGNMETAKILEEYEQYGSRKDWLDRQADEERTGLLLQSVYRGQLGRQMAWERKRTVMAQRIQRSWRSFMARVGVIRWKNRLKFAVDIIGRRYKRRLELNMFRAVMAKVRKLKQAKLLQDSVHAENERVKSEAEVQVGATLFIQSWARGWRTRRLHPVKKVHRMHKAMRQYIEAGEEKKVKELLIDFLDTFSHEKGAGKPYDRKGNTYLHLAARYGNAGMCKQFVNVGEIDIDTKNETGNTALHVCIANKKPHLARTLIRLGADVDMKNNKGLTALHMACTIAEMECVTVLIKNKADVNAKAEDGSTPMHEAAGGGRYNIMQALEQKGAKMHQPDNDGRLPLMLGIQAGATAMMGDLLKTMKRVPEEEGGPYTLDYQDKEGMTMLLHAALAGEFDIARILCLEGADVNLADKEGWTACHYAASSGDKPILQMLLQSYEAEVNARNNAKQTPLHMAADNGHKNVVPLLIKCGADTKARDEHHRAAIHLGAQANVWEVIAMMLECGDNLDQKDGDGWTPLIYGASNGFHKPLCTKMILANADLNKVDKKGRSALHHALEGGYEPLCGDIIDAGCNVNIVDETGTTPILIAARKGLCKAMVGILQAGGNSHQHDDDGWNCLNHAIRNGKHHAICLALTAMPAMHTLNDMGVYPLIQAIRELSNEDTVAQVVHNTILDRVDHRGRNPMFEAIDRGQIETVRLLIEKGCRLDQFDNDGVLPIQTVWIEGEGRGEKGEWEINTWVPSEIKAMVVRATPDDLLGEGFYKDGNSAHHYACMEGNRECIVEEGMLARIGQEFFKKRNYGRKSAYDYIVPEGHPEDMQLHPDRQEAKDFIEQLFKVARDAQLAEIAAEKAMRSKATLKLQQIARGRSQRKKFAIMYAEWVESERLRVLAEEKAEFEAKMANEIRSATQMQRIIRGLWGRRKARQRLDLLREMARQEICYREQLPYEECKKAMAMEFVPYFTGAMEESKVVSEKQDLIAEAARLVLLKRKSLQKLTSEVLSFHDDLVYVSIDDLASMVEAVSALSRSNMASEMTGSEETKQRAVYDAQGTAKAVLTQIKPTSFYEIANQRERKRCQKECGYLEEAVVTFNKVMKGDVEITALSGDESSVVSTMYMVWQSQVAKKNEETMSMMQLVIDKSKEALRIQWEQDAIVANIQRKSIQYEAYAFEKTTYEIYKDVHFKLHDDGMEEEALLLKESYDKVVESHYRGVTRIKYVHIW